MWSSLFDVICPLDNSCIVTCCCCFTYICQVTLPSSDKLVATLEENGEEDVCLSLKFNLHTLKEN